VDWHDNGGVPWLEADLDGARVAFGTRLGGVSPAPFDSLNIGILTEDSDENAIENRRRLAAALGFAPERIAYGLQVHGAELETVPSSFRGSFGTPRYPKEPRDGLAEVDGQVVVELGVAGLVFTADCLPVALHGSGGVAMLHCGWRGLAAGIVARGAAAVGATSAAIGPGIGPCCYEVGPEVLAAFADLGDGIAADGPISQDIGDKSAHRQLDLGEVARRLLVEAGVEQVQAAGLCTSCEADLFFSHRRDDGSTGRQGSLAWVDPEGSGGG
jgi:purine-nucleoside/S-methyl-5'-thioadenosine phosphorylase / adenosine deaminase